MEGLEYDANDVEELLSLSDAEDIDANSRRVLFPPLVLDLEPRAKKVDRLKKLGVLHSPLGDWPRNNVRSPPSVECKLEAPHSPYVKASPAKLSTKKRHPTKLPPPIEMETSPTKFKFKTNDIIKHGDLKVYMCRHTTIQPLFCIPFHEHSSLTSSRKLIDDLLMVDMVDYCFVAPNGKAIAKTAEGRFSAYWFHPVLTILVLSIQNTPHLCQSPDALRDALSQLGTDGRTPTKEKPWNLSYVSFGNFSSQSLRMQTAIIKSPMSSKIRKRHARDVLRLALETPAPVDDAVFETAPNGALAPSTVQTILERSRYDVLDRFSDLEVEKRRKRHLRLQQKTLVHALEMHKRAVQLQCWVRTVWSVRQVEVLREARRQALQAQMPPPTSSDGRPRRYSISLSQQPMVVANLHFVPQFGAYEEKSIVKLQALQRRRLAQKSYRQAHAEKELEQRHEMLQKTQSDYEREAALTNIKRLHKVDQKQRKELLKEHDEQRRQAAILAIQRLIRRFLAVRVVKRLRMERKAAIKIQSHLRKNTALTTLENLKLQSRKSSLNVSGSSVNNSDSYHPRLFCRRVHFHDTTNAVVLVVLTKTQISLVLYEASSASHPTAVECTLETDELKTLGLLTRSYFITVGDIDRLIEGLVMHLIVQRGRVLLNPREVHPFRNLNIDARSLVLGTPDMYFGQLYQKCSDCNSAEDLLRPLRYAKPTLHYYVAKRCYVSRWHLCLCIGLQYSEWSFSNLPVLSLCSTPQKVAIAKHMVHHITLSHTNAVRIDVRQRMFRQAKRLRCETSGSVTFAVGLFSVHRLGIALQLEVVFASGDVLQSSVAHNILNRIGYTSLLDMDAETVQILSRQMLSYLRVIEHQLVLQIDE
ncbi:hypothetical protein SPRG_03254 [Saprolegnia parasitica CBS 223.65]|uniref:Uncharacterized protein n=1 Tax=Saprolegnia parasitica (strain CBS 223.65) TaxID=695850 RepID=A0A067CYZ7_SAPPC|nr:hypothetical protein SPRG_03254 [Saprolegnia parasitica CBS 223.65]KDO32037.1 hypothetical protein SPRG_03254 [Saprolegnia parasitica CBS 223.65]|eukprot:XP_012197225.1 hypothetical protein SPRG_03254 [Saprolegnia parasitica CBS 223.65]